MQLYEILLMGIMLGLGAAVPIGPINLEMIRRNLSFSAKTGFLFGFGACCADLIYLVLLSLGVLSLLNHPLLLKVMSLIGALILMYFAYGAFTAKTTEKQVTQKLSPALYKHYFSGLLLTLTNPITILFWASISSQVVALTLEHHYATLYAGIGVMMGTVGWVVALNLFVHFTKHKISNKAINILNKIGGVLLLCFAGFSIYYCIQ
jgi:L-lysine exporter family protein LysE/ArgO